jgi:hypothetical protein
VRWRVLRIERVVRSFQLPSKTGLLRGSALPPVACEAELKKRYNSVAAAASTT